MTLAILYIITVLIAAYLIGRFGDTELTLTAIVWPIWIPLLIVSWMAMLGEKHRGGL